MLWSARRFDGFGIIAADGRPNGSYSVGHKGLSRLAIDQKIKCKSTFSEYVYI
jgi:hypothetical protein